MTKRSLLTAAGFRQFVPTVQTVRLSVADDQLRDAVERVPATLDMVRRTLRSYTQLYLIWHHKIQSSLASFKSRLILPFWYRFTQVVLEKRLLNGQ